MNESALMSVKETAEYMGVGQENIRKMIKTPEMNFPNIRLGRKYMIPREALDQWVRDSVGKAYTINAR